MAKVEHNRALSERALQDQNRFSHQNYSSVRRQCSNRALNATLAHLLFACIFCVPQGKHLPPAATLDELQLRLHELQQQRQMLKRPDLAQRIDPPRANSRQRPRTAHAAPPAVTTANANGAVQPLRPVRRPSAPFERERQGAVATAEVNVSSPHDYQRPSSARPLSDDSKHHFGAIRPRSSRLARGSFGPACQPPLFSTHSTPRTDHDRENRQSAETERTARTALLRRLIRDGYTKLGLPVPTMTPGTPLEPLLYRQEKVLGKGAFGLVSLARSVVTGELVAMKTVDKAKLTSENLKKTVEHEVRHLHTLPS